jgi:N-methylhydantoinase A/oxoprolinase/acetone carboxylase beta subunit
MLQIAVDVGGTFTDVVAARDDQPVFAIKVPSTPLHLVDGVLEGVRAILDLIGADAEEVGRFVHGTTTGTNAVLERKGATTAILTTEGFEDVLELGRLRRSALYDLFTDAETPVFLAPRRRRFGIPERVDAEGRVIKALDREAVRRTITHAVENHAIESVAVCYLFSFLNPVHEQLTRDIVAEVDSDLSVSLSSEINPVFREYERTVVTAFDAYIKPVLSRYLNLLHDALGSLGVDVKLQLMQSRGGIASGLNALERPVQLLLSGPSAGVIGGKYEGQRANFGNVITFDMGGTSSDVALVREGQPLITTEAKIETFPLRVPMVDVNTIGAGGGSIAWIDQAGGLRVGPQSAGSDPGPACYPSGGVEPTVTDASLVLGYLNPVNFAGGRFKLNPTAAERSIERLSGALAMGVTHLALGIHRVVNANMADQIRLMSVKRGHDPRKFALVAFGGAGPVHGGPLAADIGIPALVVPEKPGVLSAFGLLAAPIEHDHMRTFVARVDGVDVNEMRETFGELHRRGLTAMEAEDIPADAVQVLYSADMRYVGQSYELEVDVPTIMDVSTPDELLRRFHLAHEQVYAHAAPENAVEIVNLRAVHRVVPTPPSARPPHLDPGAAPAARSQGVRTAIFAEYPDGVETPIFDRGGLPPGAELKGPAIVEQPDTTIVVYPGHTCRVCDSGLLTMSFALSDQLPRQATV